MPRPQMRKARFIQMVQELLPDCKDPLALKQRLEGTIGHMGYAETIRLLMSYERTGDALRSLRETMMRDRFAGSDTSHPSHEHGLIEARGTTGMRKPGSHHRPTEEIAERRIRQGKRKEEE